jgi:HK97 family phage major capsid protein
MDIEQLLAAARQERDAARDAALALAQGDDFNPDADTYRSLLTVAESKDTQIGELTTILEAKKASAVVDSRILNLGHHTTSSGVVVVRDEAIYRPDGQRSFFADMHRARLGNPDAREALDRYMSTRALTTATAGGDGGNIVPPEYLASMFAPDPKFGAPVAASFPQYMLGNASAFKLPRQTVATVIANQSAENVHPTATDPDFDQVTVTPVTKTGANVFSRQLLDASNPAIDQIIAADLRGELLEANDTLASATLLATGSAGTATSADGGLALLQAILAGIPTVYGARKQPADTIYMTPAAFGLLASSVATDGRPLINAYGPSNLFGVGDTSQLGTTIGGLPVVLAPHLVDGSGTHKVILAKRSDFGWFSSPVLQFRYEEKAGPESIEIGVWQYVAALTNRYPTGVLVITHTIDSTP